MRGFNNKNSEKGFCVASWGPRHSLAGKVGWTIKWLEMRNWSRCQAARSLFRVQISDFWCVLWNCDKREWRQTELIGHCGFQRTKAVEFIPKPDRGHKRHSQDTKTVKQQKSFTLDKKKASTPSLFLPYSDIDSPNWWIPGGIEVSREIIYFSLGMPMPHVFWHHGTKSILQ